MQPMLDKDIDKLFRERFENIETPPSDFLWSRIADNLEEKKSSQKLNPIIWKAAASTVIIISSIIWFYRPVEVVKLQGQAKNNVQEDSSPIIQNSGQTVENSGVEERVSQVIIVNKKASWSENEDIALVKQPSHEEIFIHSQKVESEAGHSAEYKQAHESFIEPVQIESIEGTDVKIETSTAMVTKLDFAQSQLVESESPKIKIKSIGSLVNFVIAKVDHRENKIIEFKDSDEGSELSGINLGVLKFKNRK